MTGDLRLVTGAAPFARHHADTSIPAGGTVLDILQGLGISTGPWLRVTIDDVEVSREWWGKVRPKAGHTIAVLTAPLGGGRGKTVLRLVATIAVVAASAFLGGFIAGPAVLGMVTSGGGLSLAGMGVAAGISAVTSGLGMLAINALIPPAQARLPSGTADRTPAVFGLTGSRNQANPYGAVPQVLGKMRVYPPFAAAPRIENVGNDQYLRLLFTFGSGPLSIDTDSFKIGETALTEYDDVEVEVREGRDGDDPVTIYPTAVSQQDLNILLEEASSWTVRTTATDTNEIEVDLSFPQGLVAFQTNGDRTFRTVDVAIEYSPVGEDDWTARPTISLTENKAHTLRIGDRWLVADGQYDVRIRRVSADTDSDRIFDRVYWSRLTSVRDTDPILADGMAKVAMRIKATEQLNGVVDAFNAVVQTDTLDWDGGSWVARPTSNPASLFRHVLQGAANESPLADSRLDLGTLRAWHEWCDAEGMEHNATIDFDTTVFNVLRQIASAGRASFNVNDGLFSVVRDIPQAVPIQHFSPRNSWAFSGTKLFYRQPHGIRARFANREKGWEQDERVVYDDGFDAETAETFETLDMEGVTDPEQVWKLVRYHIAVARLRPETFEFDADLEHLVCRRGDLIRMVHDVPMYGLAAARLKAVDGTEIVLDETVTLADGTSYGVRARLADGASVVADVTAPTSGPTDTLTLAASLEGAEPGDLVLFGEQGQESVQLIVRSIEPRGDLTAHIVCVNYHAGIYTAHEGEIPAFDSQITLPADELLIPVAPVVEFIRSDITATAGAGDVKVARIILSMGPISASIGPHYPTHYQVQVRETGEGAAGDWMRRPDTPLPTNEVVVDGVEVGQTYDVRVRSLNAETHRVSAWTQVNGHTVAGDALSPPNVFGLVLEDRFLRWNYVAPANFAGFAVRWRPGTHGDDTWVGAEPAHDGLLRDSVFNVAAVLSADGPHTFLVKGVNTEGIESAMAVAITVRAGDILGLDYIELERTSLHPDDWEHDGAILTGCEVSGGALVGTGGAMTYIAQFTPPSDIIDRLPRSLTIRLLETAPATITWRPRDGALFWDEDNAATFWDADDEAIFWSAEGAAWRLFSGRIRDLTRQAYQIRLQYPGPETVTEMDLIQTGRLVERVVEGATVQEGGLRVLMMSGLPPFNRVAQIGDIALLDADVNKAVVHDKAATTGPLIRLYDPAGDPIAGQIDFTIKGA